MAIQRGESPSKSKLSTSGRIQRGESPSKAKLSVSGRIHDHDHDHPSPPLIRQHRRARWNLKPQKFVSLHHHSTFSYLDGFQMPEAHVRRVAELNMSAMALTEHGNVASHVKLEKAAEGTGVKPIFGCELYCGPIDEEHRRQIKNHLTILAQDSTGYRNLLQLVSRTFSEGFYYEPTADLDMITEHKEGLVVLSGCQGSLLFTSLMGGKGIAPEEASFKRAKAVARSFKKAFNGSYYIEVQAFPELKETCEANPQLARIARQLRIPLVATMDVHYTTVNEREMQKILHNVRGGGRKTLEEQAREWGYNAALAPPASDRAIYRRLRATGLTDGEAREAILNTQAIAEGCNVTLPKLPTIRFPNNHPRGSMGVWEDLIKEGWKSRGFDKLRGAERRKALRQLRKERRIVETKDFIDYFLVVSDVVRWAKSAGIAVGPARGSASASLICYLLYITEVNPMMFPNLVFERFIDITRADLPDIDLDFDSDERWRIREYLAGKYGDECVNNIGTFMTYKARLALDDVARVHHIPAHEVDKVKELLIERSSGDLRASATIEDTFEQFEAASDVLERYPELARAIDLEGNVKGFGIHAAGIVVSNGPITDVASVIERTVNGHRRTVISMDKYDAERQGLLKLDVLGLSTCSFLAEACRMVGIPFTDLYKLRLDDPKVIDGFKRNDVHGVFQFEGRSTRAINGALKPDNFQEIADISALSRPGPLHNGASNEYIAIKQGIKTPEAMHPIIKDITEFTKYQVIYQEQILRIVREIGNFTWTHAAYIRKIISRKLGDAEFNRQWDTFLAGAKSNGLNEQEAKDIWGLCITAGSYAFNLAHCTAYGMLGYWCMWMKVYHPEAFFAAALKKLQQARVGGGQKGMAKVLQDKHKNLMRDAVAHGIKISPPSPTLSDWSWRVGKKNEIIAGFKEIPGIGEKTAKRFLEAREEHGYKTWDDFGQLKGVGPKTVQKMKEFGESGDPFDLMGLPNMIQRGVEFIKTVNLPLPTHKADDVPYESGQDLEVAWLGVIIHRNLRDIFEVNRAKTGEELNEADVKDPHLSEWMIMSGEDGGELLAIWISRWDYPKFKKAIWDIKLNTDLVLIQGIKPGWRNARTVYVKKMWVISMEDENESV